MTRDTRQPPTSSNRVVNEHRKAARKVMKEVLKDRESARRFLIKAGLLTRSGELPRHYRAK